MNIMHLTYKHSRYDPRIFRRMCLAIAEEKNTKVHLVVTDDLDYENYEGVHIHSIPLMQSSSLISLIFLLPKLIKFVKKYDIHIIHFHDPGFLISTFFLKLFGLKIIYDAHEPYLEKLEIRYNSSAFTRFFVTTAYVIFEKLGLQFVDAVVVPQNYMKEYFKYKSKEVHTIQNFPRKTGKLLLSSSATKKIRVIYAGAIGSDRGIWEMLDNIACLKNVQLTLCGRCKPKLLSKLKKHKNWHNVRYKGFITEQHLSNIYRENDIGLIFFRDVGQYRTSHGLKTFEYMQHGLALVMPDFGDWPKFNAEYNVGFNISPQNAMEVTNFFQGLDIELIKKIGLNNQATQESVFCFNHEKAKLVDIYMDLMKK